MTAPALAIPAYPDGDHATHALFDTLSATIGDACRAVWNTGLEQRREYRRRGGWINYVEQARQMAEAKKDPTCAWLADASADVLQQTLRDLERACKTHGTWKVRWRSKSRSAPSFRFPDRRYIHVRRLSRRWGEVKLPKIGWVRFRWTRPPGGTIRNATVARDGGRWYISFCIEDGVAAVEPNGKPPVGVDRGVAVAVATRHSSPLARQPGSGGCSNACLGRCVPTVAIADPSAAMRYAPSSAD
jgi:putative transposase